MGLQHLVDLFQHFRDPQVGRFSNRCRKVLPKARQNIFIICIRCADFVQLVFQISGKIVPDVLAKIILKECGD